MNLFMGHFLTSKVVGKGTVKLKFTSEKVITLKNVLHPLLRSLYDFKVWSPEMVERAPFLSCSSDPRENALCFVGLSIGEARQNSAQSSNEEKEVFCLVVAFPLSGSEVGNTESGIERSSFRQNRAEGYVAAPGAW